MNDAVVIRNPTAKDGAPLWALIGELGALERNTCYAYVLLCSHFASSALVADQGGRLVGCVLGYRPPSRPNAMFVWQVGVHADLRGTGLATAMLARFVDLPVFEACTHLEATVGSTNEASRALFRGFARKQEVACEEGPGFPGHLFGAQSHDDEDLFRIGPIRR